MNNKAYNQLRHIVSIIEGYKPPEPLSLYLKKVFRQNPNFGSRDRKQIRSACIAWCKMGMAYPLSDTLRRLAAGIFLNETVELPILTPLARETGWDFLPIHITETWQQKWELLNKASPTSPLFPCETEISNQIIKNEWYENLFNPPSVWIRIKKNQADSIRKWLLSNIPESEFYPEYPNACRLPGMISMDNWPDDIIKHITIQDISSQRAMDEIQVEDKLKVWDCCVASGGKSMGFWDLHPGTDLYVSDMRPRSMDAFMHRKKNWITRDVFRAVYNMERKQEELIFENNSERTKVRKGFFDLIILDAPCTGSGIWRRNPERMPWFGKSEIDNMARIQSNIFQNTLPFLKSGGIMIYMTCSVYFRENEGHSTLWNEYKVLSEGYINCTKLGGDILYSAVIKK